MNGTNWCPVGLEGCVQGFKIYLRICCCPNFCVYIGLCVCVCVDEVEDIRLNNTLFYWPAAIQTIFDKSFEKSVMIRQEKEEKLRSRIEKFEQKLEAFEAEIETFKKKEVFKLAGQNYNGQTLWVL